MAGSLREFFDNTILEFLGWNEQSKRRRHSTHYLRHFRLTGIQHPLPQLRPYLQLETPTRLLYMLLRKIWNAWEQIKWTRILSSQLEHGWIDSISGERKGILLRSLKKSQKSILLVSCSCFFSEIHKNDGTNYGPNYGPNSLRTMMTALDRYLRKKEAHSACLMLAGKF